MPLSLEQGKELVVMARDTVERFTRNDRIEIPERWGKEYLNEKNGVFVTLKDVHDSLRGCIGFPYPVKPLGTATMEAAIGAAGRDPRFPKVSEDELSKLTVEVSVLTPPAVIAVSKPTDYPSMVRVGVDGLIVSMGRAGGLLLPQVATEFKLAPEDFLSETCVKAGLMPDAWLTGKPTIQKFQADIFSEVSPRGTVEKEQH